MSGGSHAFARKGRSHRSSDAAENAKGYNPSKLVPKLVTVTPYEPPISLHPDEEEPVADNEDTKTLSALKVKTIDYNVATNAKNHQTDEYKITQAGPEGSDIIPSLVVRRGQEFTVTLTFDRDIDADKDNIKLMLEFGDRPIISKGTLVTLTPEKILRLRHWSASVQSLSGAQLTVAILTPPDCYVGPWRLTVQSGLLGEADNGPRRTLLKYSHPHPVYILLNPFCKDDKVYLEDEIERDEYIFNDSGKIYNGNYKQISFKPWAFDQFLDKSGLNVQSRGNPVDIVRAISAIINSQDDSGVLMGNWSGKYDDGTAPSHWTGSVPILTEYLETGRSVQYGQCWVFSGVTTTVCRALGIPTRCVTNYSSAHDCDGSLSIDLHWNDAGVPITENNEDSIWSFHVWNEAWMSRPDLDTGYGGWQAFDATPQETSGGVYCSGPTSVRAVREGAVNLPYDGRFLFAEVNADRIHWILGKDGEWDKVIQKQHVGRKISTKRPRGQEKPKRNRLFSVVFKDDDDRLDITDTYKYDEGTEAERAAVLRANTFSTKTDIYDKKKDDVKFTLAQRDDILVGSSFDVILKIKNQTRQVRSVHVVLSLETVHYTGVHLRTLKSREFTVQLQAIKTEEAVMRVLAEEYLTFVTDQVSFRINILAKVEETKQTFADSDDFRLRRPDLEIECPQTVKVGKPFRATVKFANSLPEHLTRCGWMVQCAGMQKATKYPQKDLEPYDRASLTLTLTPEKPGTRQIIASFTSKELMDVTGLAVVEVTE